MKEANPDILILFMLEWEYAGLALSDVLFYWEKQNSS